LKEISENERFFDWRRERQEKWKKERTWAELITKTFLYSSFHYNPKVDRYRGHRSILSLEEQKTLQEVIQKNEELQDYCLLCAREEAYSNTLKSSRFIMLDSNRNLLWDKDTVQTKISNIMFGKRGPIQKIAKLAIAEDWFSAAFELCQLYKTYMFNSETEAVQTVSRFLGELATLKYNAPINPLNPKESYDNLTKEQKERLKICSVEITAALFLFGFRQVKVWDKTYSQFKPKVDMLKDLKKNRERTIEIIKKDIREVLRKRWQN
jgi:hypothetical protein